MGETYLISDQIVLGISQFEIVVRNTFSFCTELSF